MSFDLPCLLLTYSRTLKILNGGKASINDGANGLQRLDKVVATANKYGIKLLLTLTNNWNPERAMPNTAWNRRENTGDLPRGFLGNDYGMFVKLHPQSEGVESRIGGMDLYVRNFRPGGTHDLFYTDRTIVDAFKNYLAKVVPRYATHPAVLGWELGNDLRCSSTLPASSSCNTKTITNWTAEICKSLVMARDNSLLI